MNILVINWRCIKNPEMGGAEIHMHEIFKCIAAKGHKVTLIAHNFKGAEQVEIIDGIETIRVGNKFFFNRQFRRFFLNSKKFQNYDLVVDDISKIPLFTPKYIDKPLVGILHHIHGNSLYKEIPAPLAYYIIRTEKKIPKIYSGTPIFTVSPSTRNELIEMGQPEENTDLLYNAIDHELFQNVNVEKSEIPLISFIGRIKKYKQIETVIDAVALLINRFPEIQFHIGGRGDHLPKLKEYVKQKGLDGNIKFLGYLTEEQKAEVMGKSWLFITMAIKEGWGITVIEANAMGTPVIGSDVPGLRDSIQNGVTGLLSELGNSKLLADRILNLFENKNQLDMLSKNAKEWSGKFTWENSADHFLDRVKDWYPELRGK
ncbi:MAG: glycosyltransferase family 4 protein [Melioribacteraceae bacterium]|nr:glycosyltransferase family 4 protein [Melioribacteraceae bacterium]MCF8354040.1 glycosyltransferase family 4 protein [Melioribacteraceae bacterium]MCF8392279.1 glycosyltransferase family 4 protein [Melioribacteraceae bacterium]MCF8417611.1 glycosyltransferase family 4 protein [Melioribacteraceae bacterium]